MGIREDSIKKVIKKILSGLIILVLIVGAVYGFLKPRNELQFNYNGNNTYGRTFTKLEKVILTEENKVIKVNKSKIFVKALDGYLYLEDKLVNDVILPIDMNGNYYLYLTDYLIFVLNNENNHLIILDENAQIMAYEKSDLLFDKVMYKGSQILVRSKVGNGCYTEYTYYAISYDGNINLVDIDNYYDKFNVLDVLTFTKSYDAILKDNTVHLSWDDDLLHIGNNIFSKIKGIYVTDYFVLLTIDDECGEMLEYAIGANNELIKVNNGNYQIKNIHLENNHLYAMGVDCSCDDGNCLTNMLEIIYNGKEVVIK